jgi:hypothetical protein
MTSRISHTSRPPNEDTVNQFHPDSPETGSTLSSPDRTPFSLADFDENFSLPTPLPSFTPLSPLADKSEKDTAQEAVPQRLPVMRSSPADTEKVTAAESSKERLSMVNFTKASRSNQSSSNRYGFGGMNDIRCPTCAANGQESWALPGQSCGFCGTWC